MKVLDQTLVRPFVLKPSIEHNTKYKLEHNKIKLSKAEAGFLPFQFINHIRQPFIPHQEASRPFRQRSLSIPALPHGSPHLLSPHGGTLSRRHDLAPQSA